MGKMEGLRKTVVGIFLGMLSASLYATVEVETEKLDNLAKNRRVAVVNFAVEYQTKIVKSSSNFGSFSSSTVEFNLDGVSKAAMQEQTEKLYEQFVKELTDSGVEVVPMSEIKKQEAFLTLKKNCTSPKEIPFTYSDSKGIKNSQAFVFSPGTLPYHSEADHERSGRLISISNMGESLAKAFANEVPDKLEKDLALALNATLVKVYYVVGFGQASASVSERFGFNFIKEQNEKTTSHSQNVTSEIYLFPQDSRISIRVPDVSSFSMFRNSKSPSADGNGFIRLKEKVVSGTNFAVAEPKNTTGIDNTLGNAISVLGSVALSMAGAKGGSSSTQEFTVSADEKTYIDITGKLIGETQTQFIQTLKEGR